jgi:hypothetical protein
MFELVTNRQERFKASTNAGKRRPVGLLQTTAKL